MLVVGDLIARTGTPSFDWEQFLRVDEAFLELFFKPIGGDGLSEKPRQDDEDEYGDESNESGNEFVEREISHTVPGV